MSGSTKKNNKSKKVHSIDIEKSVLPSGKRMYLRIWIHSLETDGLGLGKQLLQDLGEVCTGITEMKVNDMESISAGVSNTVSGLKKFGDDLAKSFISKDIARASPGQESVLFPFPEEINEDYHQSYEANTLNLEMQLAKFGLAKAQARVGKVSGGAAAVIEDIKGYVESTAKRSNILIDPNTLMTYRGSVPRTFSLRFKIVPQNKTEMNMYLNSFKILRNYSLAVQKTLNVIPGADNIGIKYLQQNKIFSFEANYDSETSKISSSYNYINLLMGTGPTMVTADSGGFNLESTSINTGTAAFTTFYDGSPKELDITLVFKERKPLWSRDWERHIKKYAGNNSKQLRFING